MRKMFTVFALLALVGGPAAIAQTGGGTRSSAGASNSDQASSSSRRGVVEAPVGHRQPRASDVPSNSDDPMRLDADDAALDRKIKSICRGC